MFTLLSEADVSATPRKDALYFSLIVHVCAFVAFTWFSFTTDTPVRFKLIAVHAGTPEPVREPQTIFFPVRTVSTSKNVPASLTKAILHKTEIAPARQTDEGNHGDYTPTMIPPDLIASLDTPPD